MTIKLIVGLGNPGKQYKNNRHNVGAWLVERLAAESGASLRAESKFFGQIAKINLAGCQCWLLLPTTFMNDSGKAVSALARFYKITSQEILVAHDELDFPAGDIRLKEEGGHGGHNGLRSIISHLGAKDFLRMRIGIGHPGHKDKVTPYVLGDPSKADKQRILTAIDDGIRVLPELLEGDRQRAFMYLHSD